MSSTPPPKTVTAYKIPLSIIQEWPPQDTINPSRVRWVTYYFAGLHAAATAVVFIRIWTRVRKRAGGFGVDDMLIIVAWFLATVMTGIAIYGIVGIGMDKHVWDTPKQSAVLGGLIAWILEQLFLASLCLTKISVLLFFRRLIDRSYSPWITIGVWSAVGFTVAYYLAFGLFLVFVCDPVAASWKSLNITWKVKYHCADRNIVDVLVGALSVFSDLYSMVIPVYIVSKVKIERKQKMVLYAVFCCGLMVIGAGGARTYYLHKVNTSQMRDLTRVGLWGLVWGHIELELAMICASAPAMKGFLSAVHDRVITAYGSRYGSGKSGSGNERSRGTMEGSYPAGISGISDAEKVYDGIPVWGNHITLSGSGTERSKPDTERMSDELLHAPERRVRLQGGIMITETFSVDSNRHSFYRTREDRRDIP